MKKLNLKIDISELKLDPLDENKSPEEISVAIIKNVILAYGNQNRGFGEEDRRKYYKISNVFDQAIKGKLSEIELEDEWFGFIKKCFRETLLIPSKLLEKVEETVSSVNDR